MTKRGLVLQKRKSVYLAIAAAIGSFAVFASFILMLRDSLKQRESLETTQRYRTFESRVERLIYSNVIRLEGFEAYIRFHPYVDEEIAYQYLDRLLAGNSEYIRNIGVIEDTTILWNYPRDPKAIGVDLAAIDVQRELVLKVKNEHKPLLQGPIELVQGDSGFSVRHPILRDGVYWGQTSIVLKTDKILEAIRSYAESAELSIALYNQENRDVPFFGPAGAFENQLVFDMDPSFINWRVHVDLSGGRSGSPLLFAGLTALAVAVSALAGMLVYKYLKYNYEILNMSIHDHLTGLFNRYFLSEYQVIALAAAKREGRRAAVLMIDLDGFKKINDTYGHEVGDKALIETARILERFTRAGETVFRLGGDEFLILIPEIDGDRSLPSIRARLTRCFEQDFAISGYPVKIVFSLGYALFPEDGEDFDSLLREADRRLYQDKADKRNKYEAIKF